MHQIFVLSDGTGKTAKQALRAALTQFSEMPVSIQLRPEIRTKQQILHIIKETIEVNGFILHTLVSHDLRDYLIETGKFYNIETIDLMGPLLAQLSSQFSNPPSEQPGLFAKLNKAYFQRIEAMEFAFRHDDGQRTHELDKAEIILVGVSRTFKTPLSIYFAFKGWMVANVPIVLNIPSTPILKELPKGRVIGLTTNPANLANLRKVRHTHLGGATGNYADLDFVRREVIHANRIFENEIKCPIVDVTKKPIEEIAYEIITIIRKNLNVPHDKDPFYIMDK